MSPDGGHSFSDNIISMKDFFHSHPNIIIGTLVVIFIIILAGFYSWAIDDVFTQISRSLASPLAQSVSGFDLSAASKLNLRGLMGPVASSSTSTP